MCEIRLKSAIKTRDDVNKNVLVKISDKDKGRCRQYRAGEMDFKVEGQWMEH